MEYVKKFGCPNELFLYRKQYTQSWIDHYVNQNRTKPTDCFWTDDNVRLPLIKSFKNNCAYCGKEIDRHNDNKPAGQVDHFIPKSHSPRLVYVWENYVWSCSVCNFKKREAIGLLNPCNENEMKYLDFDGATGMYILKKIYKGDLKIKKKYEMTINKTLLNTKIVKEEKKNAYSELNDCIKNLMNLPKIMLQPNTLDVQSYFTKEFKKAFETLKRSIRIEGASHIFTRKRIIRNICKKEKIKITELFFSSRKSFQGLKI